MNSTTMPISAMTGKTEKRAGRMDALRVTRHAVPTG